MLDATYRGWGAAVWRHRMAASDEGGGKGRRALGVKSKGQGQRARTKDKGREQTLCPRPFAELAYNIGK